jgi:hypothetical protein
MAVTEASCSAPKMQIDESALRHCLALALTYHLNRRKRFRPQMGCCRRHHRQFISRIA